MKGSYGVPMQAHSRFKNKKDYWKWVRLKNKGYKKKEEPYDKDYRLVVNGKVIIGD